MSSNASPPSGLDLATAGRPSYESFLRIKQGIGNEALRAAGLPSAEHLSYDAYVTALNRKAAEARANETPAASAAPGKTSGKTSGQARSRNAAWTGVVVVPVAIVFVILVAGILQDRPGSETISSGTEAIAAPLTGDGLPVALNITATEDMLVPGLPAELTTEQALPTFENAAPDLPVVETAEVAAVPVELLVGKPAPVKKKKAAATAPKETTAAVMPVPERRATPQTKQTTVASKPARKRQGDDFWQPLVDLLNGKGVRGARNVPAPEDRAGR